MMNIVEDKTKHEKMKNLHFSIFYTQSINCFSNDFILALCLLQVLICSFNAFSLPYLDQD